MIEENEEEEKEKEQMEESEDEEIKDATKDKSKNKNEEMEDLQRFLDQVDENDIVNTILFFKIHSLEFK